jgi:KDO2-lipid IV(A) lauroyltransferase
VLFAFASFIRFIIYRVIGYRKKVVIQNLKGSFPEMSQKELNRIVGLFYKNLTDVFLEGIKAFLMTRGQILKRHKITNPEVLDHFFKSGQSVIGVTGHYNNWEWGSLSASLQTEYNTIAFYKPLNNPYIDRFVRWSRSKFGTTLASITETSKTFEEFKNTKTIFMMAADQGMPHKFKDKAYWVQFLNRDTAFLHGLEKHAKINNLPVVYVDIQRVKRGFYEIELLVLTTNPLELADGVLTQMYAQKLESVIRKKPENWLWSHRRWKISR